MKKTKIAKKAEKRPTCPFWKMGTRCVLVPQIREYDNCGSVACTVESVVQVSRPNDS